jgi:2,4-dienoyl-CoA reductase-like NADH-dependent reductase (Old Yellow Enzyme family)
MTQPFPHLFSPLKLGAKTLKHRLNFGAHTANMSVDGLPMERHLGYYRERARGGAAMIVVEPVPAHRTGVLTRGNFRHGDDTVVPHFRKITDACHEHGTVMIMSARMGIGTTPSRPTGRRRACRRCTIPTAATR